MIWLCYWLSGPRILNGLVRPGISFNASDLWRRATTPRPMASKEVALIGVCTRVDGAIVFGHQNSLSEADSSDATVGRRDSNRMRHAAREVGPVAGH
jgi:hypothetical protein